MHINYLNVLDSMRSFDIRFNAVPLRSFETSRCLSTIFDIADSRNFFTIGYYVFTRGALEILPIPFSVTVVLVYTIETTKYVIKLFHFVATSS